MSRHPRLGSLLLVSSVALIPTARPARAQYFREVRSLPVPGRGSQAAAAAADFNGDGIVDLAISHRNPVDLTGGVRVHLGQGGGAFGPPIVSGNAPFGWRQAAVGDLNEDGRPDLAIANGAFAALLSDGAGHFTTVPFGFAGTAHGVQIADADRDGHLDLLGFERTLQGQSRLLVYRGNGAGAFTPPVSYGVAFQRGGIAVADLTGDGAVDVVMTDREVGRVYVLLNNGAGLFALAGFYTIGDGVNRVALGDLNADGRPDLVIANPSAHALLVMLASGPGTFAAPVAHPGPGLGPAEPSVSVSDLDGDGRLDVVVSDAGVWVYAGNGGGGLASPRAYVATGVVSVSDLDGDGRRDLAAGNGILLNRGALDFEAPRQYAVGRAPRAVAAADLNHDGRVDLLTANRDSDDLSVLLGLGGGAFAAATSIPAGDTPQRLAVADFNHDGHPDVAVTNHDASTVGVLLGTGTGAFTPGTAIAVVAPDGVSAGDFNADGSADLAVATQAGIAIATGAGNGTFAPAVVKPLPAAARAVAAADLNLDFHRDLVAGVDTTPSSVAALLGIGGAQYLPASLPFESATATITTTLPFDLNADFLTDLAFASDSAPAQVLRGDGTGAFSSVPIASGARMLPFLGRGLAAADVTRDGIPDLLSGSLSVLVGNGTAFAVADRPVGTAGPVADLVAADFDGDGRPDVAVVLRDGDAVDVLLSQAAPIGADLALAAAHTPDPVVPGGLLTFTLTATNQGPLVARDAAVSFEIPPGATLDFAPSSCVAPSSAPPRLVCALGDVAASGSAAVSVRFVVAAPGGAVVLRADVDAVEPRDPDPFDNEAVHAAAVVSPDLSVTVDDTADPVAPGAAFAYVVQLTNHGPAVATGVRVQDELPPQIAFVSASAPGCSFNAGAIDCFLPDLPAGQSTTVTFQVTAGPFTSVTNVVRVTAAYDPDQSDNEDAEETRADLSTGRELVHGARLDERFAVGSADRVYFIREEPYSSYEVVVDGLAGDVAPAGGSVQLERLDPSQSVVQASSPSGFGPARSLRWENASSAAVVGMVRVRSTGCGTSCDAGDRFRIRAYETTGRIARFRNQATQVTVAVVQNPTPRDVSGTMWIWSEQGALVGSVPFSAGPRGLARVDLFTVVPGRSGTVTVTHDAPYGALAGKAVGLEPGLGFSFDTIMLTRAR